VARNLLIIGNWKMNPATLAEAKEISTAVRKIALKVKHTTVVIASPSIFLPTLAAKKSLLFFAAQDVSSFVFGAHTGDVSASMAKSAGARFVIVGHSERRAAGDTDEIVRDKFARAIEAGLVPILCVGEKKRDSDGDYFSEIFRELSAVLKTATAESVPKFVVAYEPVWAVGGAYENALSPEEMRAMAIFIKKTCAQFIPTEKALKIPVLYGGSIDVENAKMMIAGGVDGLLVGRESLNPEHFVEIIKFADA